jgi:transcriptional regulator with XRE-family HTH domain
MKIHRWSDLKRSKSTPEEIADAERWAEEELIEMNLREIRETIGKTQAEVAKVAEMTQSELSRAERRQDLLLSTLRRCVEALGGEVEIIANFGDRRVRLRI